MKLKRILSGVIGLPIVVLILIFGNVYVIDAVFAIIALVSRPCIFKEVFFNKKTVLWVNDIILILLVRKTLFII